MREHYCLSKDELEKFIDYKLETHQVGDIEDYLKTIIEQSENWQTEISILSYFFSQIIESKMKTKDNDVKKLINNLYELKEILRFLIQEFDYNFIEMMLRSERQENLSLEDNLIDLQNAIGNHEYKKIIRY